MSAFLTVESAFSAGAQSYESERRLLIPCFDQYYGNAIEIVTEAVRDVAQPRILDLGAGTGLLTALLEQFLPTASFHLVDLSEAMLQRGRERFAAEAARFAFEVADLTTFQPVGRWDAVVSALAIHHLTDSEKRDLYTRIVDWLEPGGVFVNVEQVLGPTPELEARYDRIWRRQALELGAPPLMVDRAKERMAFDRCATLEAQLEWLRAAGFAQVDCTFKSWRFAVLAAWT